jgi:hypothetical protein
LIVSRQTENLKEIARTEMDKGIEKTKEYSR